MEKLYLGELPLWPRPDSSGAAATARRRRLLLELQERHKRCKLVEIQYLRRPPTIGLLYLALVASGAPAEPEVEAPEPTAGEAPPEQLAAQGEPAGQVAALCLSVVSLTANKAARLKPIRRVTIGQLQRQQQQQQATAPAANQLAWPQIIANATDELIDFDTNETLSLEAAPANEQQLARSCCALLTRAGILYVVSLIDCTLKWVLNLATGQQQQQPQRPLANPFAHNRQQFGTAAAAAASPREQFVCCKLNLIDGDDGQPAGHQSVVVIHTLAEHRYQAHELLIGKILTGATPSDSVQVVHLVSEYSLTGEQLNEVGGAGNKTGARFCDLHLVNCPNSSQTNQASVVLLEMSNGTTRIMKQSRCIYAGPLPNNASANHHDQGSSGRRICVLPASVANNQQAVVIYYSRRQLVCYGLLIDYELGGGRALGESGANSVASRADPDRLLPSEPSFELEKWWSIQLDDIDSIRSLDDDDDDDNQDCATTSDEKATRQHNSIGCLFPLWSSGQPTPLGWPKFLCLAHKHHLLFYSFEQAPVSPFSLVYDRAFVPLGADWARPPGEAPPPPLDSMGWALHGKPQTRQAPQETIDLRLKPRLVHNFKLIGPQPSDSLFNTLFLVNKINLIQARHLNSLGLLFGVSQRGHLLAFKLKSEKLIGTHQDNIYQVQLLDALREGSLLRDELSQLENNLSSLTRHIDKLERQANAVSSGQQAPHLVDNLDNMLQVALVPDERVAGVSNLQIFCSNLIQIQRILVLSTANSYIFAPPTSEHPGQSVESISVKNYCNFGCGEGDWRACVVSSDKLAADEQNRSDEADGQLAATAVIKLTGQRQLDTLISLPVFVFDGPVGGRLAVYFVLDQAPTREESILRSLAPGSRPFHSDFDLGAGDQFDPPNEIHLPTAAQLMTSLPSVWAKYCRREIPIRQLFSYRNVTNRHNCGQSLAASATDVMRLLCLSCERDSANELINFLSECLQQSATASAKQASNLAASQPVNLESSFTHCQLSYQLESPTKLRVVSDDFVALELIRHHVLARATDQSIKVEVGYSIPSAASLGHLISRQKINYDQTWPAGGGGGGGADWIQSERNARRSGQSVELLLDNLLLELNSDGQLGDPLESFNKSTNLLEKSLRQDVQKLFKTNPQLLALDDGEQPTTGLPDRQSVNQSIAMRGLIGRFVLDALLKFDRLHNKCKISPQREPFLHQHLVNFLNSEFMKTTTSQQQFADRLLAEWASLRSEN